MQSRARLASPLRLAVSGWPQRMAVAAPAPVHFSPRTTGQLACRLVESCSAVVSTCGAQRCQHTVPAAHRVAVERHAPEQHRVACAQHARWGAQSAHASAQRSLRAVDAPWRGLTASPFWPQEDSSAGHGVSGDAASACAQHAVCRSLQLPNAPLSGLSPSVAAGKTVSPPSSTSDLWRSAGVSAGAAHVRAQRGTRRRTDTSAAWRRAAPRFAGSARHGSNQSAPGARTRGQTAASRVDTRVQRPTLAPHTSAPPGSAAPGCPRHGLRRVRTVRRARRHSRRQRDAASYPPAPWRRRRCAPLCGGWSRPARAA